MLYQLSYFGTPVAIAPGTNEKHNTPVAPFAARNPRARTEADRADGARHADRTDRCDD
jgi:hypothetical protein